MPDDDDETDVERPVRRRPDGDDAPAKRELPAESKAAIDKLKEKLEAPKTAPPIDIDAGKCIFCEGSRLSINYQTRVIFCHHCNVAYSAEGWLLDKY